jgi:hypothetical protein
MGTFNVSLSSLGELAVACNGNRWLDGGVIAVRESTHWYASNCSSMAVRSCAPLFADALDRLEGTDAIGTYKEDALRWSLKRGGLPLIVTGVRRYAASPDTFVLTQHFPQGLRPGNVHGTTEEIVSAFPTLGRSHLDLGVLLYEGVQLQNTRFFRWSAGAPFTVPKWYAPPHLTNLHPRTCVALLDGGSSCQRHLHMLRLSDAAISIHTLSLRGSAIGFLVAGLTISKPTILTATQCLCC